jgi:hypothetical protein
MDKLPNPVLTRRRVFTGAGTAGALAAAAVVLPLAEAPPGAPADAAGAPPADADGRYQPTQHVLHYYQTARV